MKPVMSPEYRALNKHLHDERADYGAKAYESAASIVRIARAHGYKTVLDYGCGKGTLKPAVKAIAPDIKVMEFDPAIPGKDKLPKKSPDFLVALDVMEHIEPDYLANVLSAMRGLAPKSVLLMIAIQPANKTLPDGRNAHLIVEPREWWEKKLNTYFKPVDIKADAEHVLYIGTPL